MVLRRGIELEDSMPRYVRLGEPRLEPIPDVLRELLGLTDRVSPEREPIKFGIPVRVVATLQTFDVDFGSVGELLTELSSSPVSENVRVVVPPSDVIKERSDNGLRGIVCPS